MLEVGTLGWAVMIGLIVALLAVDLVLATLRPHAVGFREAAAWSLFYIAVAMAFGVVFQSQAGGQYGAEYFAGYLVEKSLSVDNVFVFVIIMQTFAVPEKHQHKVLTIGIVAALLLRAVFITLGAALLELFSFMFLVFGLVLVATAVQLYRCSSPAAILRPAPTPAPCAPTGQPTPDGGDLLGFTPATRQRASRGSVDWSASLGRPSRSTVTDARRSALSTQLLGLFATLRRCAPGHTRPGRARLGDLGTRTSSRSSAPRAPTRPQPMPKPPTST